MNLGKTERQNFALLSLFFRNAPPQINLDKFHLALSAPLSKFRKDELGKVITFLFHILKGG